MTAYFSTFTTPLGDFSVGLDDTGALLATAFGDIHALKKRFSADHYIRDDSRTDAVRGAIIAYFAGERRPFSLALAPRGTAFQQRVWRALRAIPFGETRSYGELAAGLGNPGASRAVGRANAINPLCLIVPCHRVIGADGSLTGFAFGEPLKRRLLEHERALAIHPRAA